MQEYLASELGLDGDPNRIVKVYRPAEEVFAQESLDSYHGVDVTLEHPKDMVNAENYKSVTVGVVRAGGVQDGNHVRVDTIIKAADAIKAVESGKAELSAGYTAIYDDNVPDELASQGIEFIQRDIRVNHVALVDRARAGASARLFDGKKGVSKMPISVTLDSKRSVEVEDKATAALISDTLESLNKRVADAEAAQAKAEAERDEAMEEKEEADKKASDSAIDARVKDLLNVRDGARKIAGKDFTCDSTDPVEVMRAAMIKVKPNRKDWADKSAAYIQGAFDAEMEKEEEDEDKESTDADLKQLAQDASRVPGGDKPNPREARDAAWQSAWNKEDK